MVIDGRKVQKSRAIAQELDRLQPEPPLFPSDPEQREAVLEAERFGDEELQSTDPPDPGLGDPARAGGAASYLRGIEARPPASASPRKRAGR